QDCPVWRVQAASSHRTLLPGGLIRPPLARRARPVRGVPPRLTAGAVIERAVRERCPWPRPSKLADGTSVRWPQVGPVWEGLPNPTLWVPKCQAVFRTTIRLPGWPAPLTQRAPGPPAAPIRRFVASAPSAPSGVQVHDECRRP